MPKKILFLIPSLAGGGAERVFSILLRHLDRNQFELHLAVLEVDGNYMNDIPKDVAVHDLKVSRVRYALPNLVRLIWEVRPQTVLSTLAHLNLALVLSKPLLPRGTKLLIREAALAGTVIAEETKYPQLWSWLYRSLYRRVDKVICLCDAMANDMVRRFDVPREKLVRIYNPVDIETVREQAQAADNPYSGSGPHLVSSGRYCRAKGFDLLLEAMPAVRACFPDVQLTIVGEGPLRVALAEQVGRLGLRGVVHFLGFHRNPWPYFKYADLFVLPSRYEGVSNVILEALALRVPVVATDCPGGTREIADVDPKVHLVPTEDAGSLAHMIISLCRESNHTSIEDSKGLMERFGIVTILREYSALLSA